ncbi:hypothetical protein LXA43DRAFT_1145460 [Ganoderma leucocontextum]|nr:hypothetical protein LXA43DRAFT_1145460 [Ganoderma leucocontextum]
MNVKNQGPASVLGLMSSKKACDWCSTPRAEDVALKQCMGCTVTRYCSKECQTAAWPSHKYICASRSAIKVPPIYSMLGHATLAELAQAAEDWSKVHKLTLFMLSTVLVEIGGGVDVALNEPRAIIFDLEPPIACASDGTPSTTFTLKSMGFIHRDSLDRPTAAHSAPWAIAYRASLGKLLRTASPYPDIVGLISVVFFFRDSMLAPQITLPLYRPRGVADERTKTVLKKMIETCKVGINTGTVFRIPTDAGQTVPDIGKLVQQGKDWTWTPHASLATIPMMEVWGPSEDNAFATYHRLWPYSSLLDNASR